MEMTFERLACRAPVRLALVAVLVGLGGLGPPATSAQVEDTAKKGSPPTVLFMCPHGAAKSVLASAYFKRLARERGLNVRVEAAGTEPDAAVSPAVADHLTRQGYEVPVAKPRKATPEDLASADVVISLGCDLTGLPQPSGKLVRWDEVPAPSEDFNRADEAIRKRVTELVDEMLRARQSKNP